MFISKKPLIYVRHIDQQGTSKNTGNPYHLRQVTLSDGIESFTLNFAEHLVLNSLNRGDLVDVQTFVLEQGNRKDFVVGQIAKTKSA